jgi:hypothetical protein
MRSPEFKLHYCQKKKKRKRKKNYNVISSPDIYNYYKALFKIYLFIVQYGKCDPLLERMKIQSHMSL